MSALWKSAHQKVNILQILRFISLILGITAFIVCIGLTSRFYGFDQGFLIGEEIYKQPKINDIILSQDGLRIYEFFAYKYDVVIWISTFFLLGKLLELMSIYNSLKTKIISQIICIGILGLSLYKFWYIVYWKYEYLQDYGINYYGKLLHNTIWGDWIWIFITVILMIIEIIGLLILFFAKKTTETNSKVMS